MATTSRETLNKTKEYRAKILHWLRTRPEMQFVEMAAELGVEYQYLLYLAKTPRAQLRREQKYAT